LPKKFESYKGALSDGTINASIKFQGPHFLLFSKKTSVLQSKLQKNQDKNGVQHCIVIQHNIGFYHTDQAMNHEQPNLTPYNNSISHSPELGRHTQGTVFLG
jgi:hypothetical protein